MKDKSRFLSSVIVSLLAGFIYLLAGDNSPVNIQSSVKAVLSDNGPDMYLTTECFPFYEITKKSNPKISKYNSKFYINKSETEEQLYSEGNQAKFIRPLPEKNIDFTSELNKLINNETNDQCNTNIDQSGITKILSCNENQIADAKRNFKREDRINKQNIESILKYDIGNGFKFNYVDEDINGENIDCDTKVISTDSDCNENIIRTTANINDECNSTKNLKKKNKNINKNKNKNKNKNSDKTNYIMEIHDNDSDENEKNDYEHYHHIENIECNKYREDSEESNRSTDYIN